MTTGVLCTPPILQFFANNGQFVAGGSILTQVGGINQATYQDVGLTIPLPNPIPLNSRGEISNASGVSCQLFLTPNIVYTFTFSDADGNQIWQASYVNGLQLTQAQLGQLLFPRTAPEIAAGITPTNYAYLPGYALRYGNANDANRLQQTIDCGHKAFWPDAAYSLGTTQLVLRSNLHIESESIGGVVLTYTGVLTAIIGVKKSNIVIEPGFTLMTTDPAANGMGLQGSWRQITLGTLLLYGDTSASNTGIGLELSGGDSGQPYSGSLYVKLLNTLGYKFGIRAIGTDTNATCTTMSFEQVLINGRSAGPIAGSVGIWFDALTNGVGSICQAGAIQGFAVPVRFDNGTYGMDINIDMEGNTSNTPVFGASVNAEYRQSSAGGDAYEQRAFLGAAVYRRLVQTGRVTQETKFGPKTIVTDASGGVEDIALYRGASALDGGNPTIVGGVHVSTSDDLADPSRTWQYAPNGINKMCWGSADPTAGTWNQGDIRWKTTVAAGGTPGSICTTPGTYSTATDNTGDTDGSTSLITGLTDTSDFLVGQWVTISAGFASTGPFRITALATTTMNVNANSNSAQSNVTISTPDPIWKAMANVAA